MTLEKHIEPCIICEVEDDSNVTCQNCLEERNQQFVGMCKRHRPLHQKPTLSKNEVRDCYPYEISNDPYKGRYKIIICIWTLNNDNLKFSLFFNLVSLISYPYIHFR